MPMFFFTADVEVCRRHFPGINKWLSYFMNRQEGSGEVYAYLPEFEKNTEILLTVPPKSYGNSQYGFSVGRGAFVFPRGQWITVAERVRLNGPGEENGN
jgi:hypothetical protein